MDLYNAILAWLSWHIVRIFDKFLRNFEAQFCTDIKYNSRRCMESKFWSNHNSIPNNPYIFHSKAFSYSFNQIKEEWYASVFQSTFNSLRWECCWKAVCLYWAWCLPYNYNLIWKWFNNFEHEIDWDMMTETFIWLKF